MLYNAPGLTAFPIRLAAEIAQRCFTILEENGSYGPYTIYDPCSGGAYLLTSIGFLHGKRLRKIIASDCDSRAIAIAKKNLSLLKPEGIKKRICDLKNLVQTYNKPSHIYAIQSAATLVGLIEKHDIPLEIQCFELDIMHGNSSAFKADIVITDFPYGRLANWVGGQPPASPFLSNISKHLKPGLSVAAVVQDKSQKLNTSGFKKIEQFKIGKRRVSIFLFKGLE